LADVMQSKNAAEGPYTLVCKQYTRCSACTQWL